MSRNSRRLISEKGTCHDEDEIGYLFAYSLHLHNAFIFQDFQSTGAGAIYWDIMQLFNTCSYQLFSVVTLNYQNTMKCLLSNK